MSSKHNSNPINSNQLSSPIAQDFNQRMRLLTSCADRYLEDKGYQVAQHNGQRISVLKIDPAAFNDVGRNEVFVGKIPRDMFEDELLPVMMKAGRVYKFRLMMDFSGTNRGFGFVKYMSQSEAFLACSTLNNKVIRPDNPPIGVLLSFDNKRLYFGNLPAKCTKDKLLKELRKILVDVKDAHLPECSLNSDKRFAFVTFESHDAATKARRVLVPGDVRMFNRIITVDWAKPDSSANNNNNNTQSPPVSQRIDYNNNGYGYSNTNDNNNSGNIRVVDNLQVALPKPTILGLKATQMLEACSPISLPNDQEKIITICNISPGCASLTQLKRIFQLGGRLDVVHIMHSGFGSITIQYKTTDQADLMLEALVLMPGCFDKLALPNQVLLAYRGSMVVDMNANYQMFNYSNHHIPSSLTINTTTNGLKINP